MHTRRWDGDELDARLRMPSGHGYWMVHPNIVDARLNADGRNPHDGKTHSALTLRALLAAGLITQMMYDEAFARQASGAHTGAVLALPRIKASDYRSKKNFET